LTTQQVGTKAVATLLQCLLLRRERRAETLALRFLRLLLAEQTCAEADLTLAERLA
jgi:hypothetical protein